MLILVRTCKKGEKYCDRKFTDPGSFVIAWGSEGSGDGEFRFPCGIAVDGDGDVYIADTLNHRVQIFRWVVTAPTPTPAPGFTAIGVIAGLGAAVFIVLRRRQGPSIFYWRDRFGEEPATNRYPPGPPASRNSFSYTYLG